MAMLHNEVYCNSLICDNGALRSDYSKPYKVIIDELVTLSYETFSFAHKSAMYLW